jgi:hypothetical protein
MSNQEEIDQIKAELAQTKGKLVAVERESYENKRLAEQAKNLVAAQEKETQVALLEASQQMKIALGVSQGIYALGQMGRNFIAKKAASCRVVHREGQIMILMQQMIDGVQQVNKPALDTAIEKAKAMIEIIRKDGEANRIQAAEAALAYGLKNFEEIFDRIVTEGNPVV